MLTKKTWQEFQITGLLWWINRILHTFGWAIVLVQEDDGHISDAYPARCTFRGFEIDDEERGYRMVAKYMASEAKQLQDEAKQ